jgi:hypothetical protein
VYHILALKTTDVLMSGMAKGKEELLDAFLSNGGDDLLKTMRGQNMPEEPEPEEGVDADSNSEDDDEDPKPAPKRKATAKTKATPKPKAKPKSTTKSKGKGKGKQAAATSIPNSDGEEEIDHDDDPEIVEVPASAKSKGKKAAPTKRKPKAAPALVPVALDKKSGKLDIKRKRADTTTEVQKKKKAKPSEEQPVAGSSRGPDTLPSPGSSRASSPSLPPPSGTNTPATGTTGASSRSSSLPQLTPEVPDVNMDPEPQPQSPRGSDEEMTEAQPTPYRRRDAGLGASLGPTLQPPPPHTGAPATRRQGRR